MADSAKETRADPAAQQEEEGGTCAPPCMSLAATKSNSAEGEGQGDVGKLEKEPAGPPLINSDSEEVYRPLTVVKCHTDLLHLTQESAVDTCTCAPVKSNGQQLSKMNSVETKISVDKDSAPNEKQENAMSSEKLGEMLDGKQQSKDNDLPTFDKKEKDEESCNLQSKAKAKQVQAIKTNVEAAEPVAAMDVCKQQETDILPRSDSAKLHPIIPSITITTPEGAIERITDAMSSSFTTHAEVGTNPCNSTDSSLDNQNTAISQSSLVKDDTLNSDRRGCQSLISENISEHTEPPVTSGQEVATNDASEKSLCGKTSSASLQFKSSDLSVSLDSQSASLPNQSEGENHTASRKITPSDDNTHSLREVQDSTPPIPNTHSGDYIPDVAMQGYEKSPAGADGEGLKLLNNLSQRDKPAVDNNLLNHSDDKCNTKQPKDRTSGVPFMENNTISSDKMRKKSVSEDTNKHSFDCNNSHIDEEEYLLAEAESMFFAEFGKEAITAPTPNNSPSEFHNGDKSLQTSQRDNLSRDPSTFIEKSKESIADNCSCQVNNQAPALDSVSMVKIAGNKRIVTSEWVTAKPFQPRAPPVEETESVCQERGAQYFNNNNCHNRSTNKSHMVSGKSGEYADNSESLDHSGEDNSQDDVLDIIVLPDNQDKQTHPQQQFPARSASAPRFHAPTPQFRPPRLNSYPPHTINRPGFSPSNHCRFASANLSLAPPPMSHHTMNSVAAPGYPRAPVPSHFTGIQLRPAVNPPRLPRYPQVIPLPPPAPAFPARLPPSPPTVPLSSIPPTSTLQIPPFNSLPFATHVPAPKEFLNPPKLCSVRDGVVPYQEIDGCCYFDPSYIPDKPPPGLQYGYPQRGKRRKAMRLSSRFPTQAGKFHHHANFYVRSCAENALGQGEDNSSN